MEESGNTLEVVELKKVGKNEAHFDTSSLKAFSTEGQITLEWTAVPGDLFNILRSQEEDGEYVHVNEEVISAPEDSGTATYSYTDVTANGGITYYYKLERITPDNESIVIGPIPATPRLLLGKAD